MATVTVTWRQGNHDSPLPHKNCATNETTFRNRDLAERAVVALLARPDVCRVWVDDDDEPRKPAAK